VSVNELTVHGHAPVTLVSRALTWQSELVPPTSAASQPSRADGAVQLIGTS